MCGPADYPRAYLWDAGSSVRALFIAAGIFLAGCRAQDPCADQRCEVDAGEDSGIPDAGTLLADGGVARDCVTVPFVPRGWTRAGYFTPPFDAPSTAVTLGPSGAGPYDFLDVDLWYFGSSVNPTFPYPVMLWATTRAQCEVCVVFKRGCDTSGGGCSRAYLSFGGSIVFDVASRDAGAGRIGGSAAVLRFVEWDFARDAELDGGSCVEVPDVSFDAGW